MARSLVAGLRDGQGRAALVSRAHRPDQVAARRRRIDGQDGGMNVFADYAETHWVPINGEMVTVQTIDATGKRETHVLSVPDALAQFKVKYPFVDDAQAAALFAQGG
jgi:hypothetical protein